jgi:hypothetical protein
MTGKTTDHKKYWSEICVRTPRGIWVGRVWRMAKGALDFHLYALFLDVKQPMNATHGIFILVMYATSLHAKHIHVNPRENNRTSGVVSDIGITWEAH